MDVNFCAAARQAALSLGTIRQDLQKLVKLDLVQARRDGNHLYYRANTDHPLFPEIRNLVLTSFAAFMLTSRNTTGRFRPPRSRRIWWRNIS